LSYNYDLKRGDTPVQDIFSPFDFDVYKSEETYHKELESATNSVLPVYKVSENLQYNAQKNIDFIFLHFNENQSIEQIKSKLEKNGYDFSKDCIQYLLIQKQKQKTYEYLSEQIASILEDGIYPDSYKHQTIKFEKYNRIKEYNLSSRYSLEEAKNRLIDKNLSEIAIEIKIISKIADLVLVPNIVINEEMTKLERQKAQGEISKIIGDVKKGEKIIEKGRNVNQIELLTLQSLQKAAKEYPSDKSTNQIMQSAFGVFVFSLFIFLLFQMILELFFKSEFSTIARLSVVLGSIVLTIILTIIIHDIIKVSSLILPFSFSILLIIMIFDLEIGLLFIFINFVFVSLFLNWNIINPIMLSLGTFGGVISIKKVKNGRENYPSVIYLLLSFFVIISVINLIQINDFSVYLMHLLWGMLSCLISIFGIAVISPFIEKKLNMATKQNLLNLIDFDNPLMQKLSKSAPGTYHHSVIVGNLAETAAEAIGANHLLARVGSYFHDIGKIENPHFFIENNPKSAELHDKMMANESARTIKNHINNGVALAKKYNIPLPVIQIIQQHHGTSRIKYFYNKAIETNLKIDENEFNYFGPKPKSKEAAIVMIADVVESTTKSLQSFEEKDIKQVIEKTVANLIDEGQLSDAPLTLKDLETIKIHILPILMGVYRKRLEYPEN
jgi:cyclic-di-AMP phosphodiesterase PgpH